MTAHPKVCPVTGELIAFSYLSPEPPYLHYIRISADGRVTQLEGIDIPNMVMMHDFNVTQNHVVFMDLPVCFDLGALESGLPFRFNRDAGARLGVMPRHGTNDDVRWFEIDPCYVFHPVNAHEAGHTIVLHVSRQPEAFGTSNDDYAEVGRLWRWTIDLDAGTVSEEQIDDRPGDFGRVDDRRVGLDARYGYLMAMAGEGVAEEPVYGSALWKYDLRSGACEEHHLGEGVRGAEPVFATGVARSRRGRGLGHQPVARHEVRRVEASDHRCPRLLGFPGRDGPPPTTRAVRSSRQLGARSRHELTHRNHQSPEHHCRRVKLSVVRALCSKQRARDEGPLGLSSEQAEHRGERFANGPHLVGSERSHPSTEPLHIDCSHLLDEHSCRIACDDDLGAERCRPRTSRCRGYRIDEPQPHPDLAPRCSVRRASWALRSRCHCHGRRSAAHSPDCARCSTTRFLFAQVGRCAVPRAEKMKLRVEHICSEIEQLFEPEVFDPASADISFVVAAPDYLAFLLSRALVVRLRDEAPGIRIRFVDPPLNLHELLRDATIDLGVAGNFHIWPNIEYESLFYERVVAVVANDHPLAKRSRVRGADLAKFPGVNMFTSTIASKRETRPPTGVPSLDWASQILVSQFSDAVLLAVESPTVA